MAKTFFFIFGCYVACQSSVKRLFATRFGLFYIEQMKMKKDYIMSPSAQTICLLVVMVLYRRFVGDYMVDGVISSRSAAKSDH